MSAIAGGAPNTVLYFHVDNQAMASVIRSGGNPADEIQVKYVTTTLMAADIYTKAFQDAVKWTNLCEQINIFDQSALKKPDIHALHNLLRTESVLVTGKKINVNLNMIPAEYNGWDCAWGWHKRENVHYMVVREPKLYRTCSESNYGRRTVGLKNSQGWKMTEDRVAWQVLPDPKQKILEWTERAVFLFEMGVTPRWLDNLNQLAACLDLREIEMPHCNVISWRKTLHGKGSVSESDCTHGSVVESCCNLVNVRWSFDDEEDNDFIDTIEAVTLGPKGVYPSLIGTLVIVIHEENARLITVNQAHVAFRSFSKLPILICRCLFQELEGRSSSPAVVCAPAKVVVMAENTPWNPWPRNPRVQLNAMTDNYYGRCFSKLMTQKQSEEWIERNVPEMPILMIEMLSLMRSLAVKHKTQDDLPETDYVLGIAQKYQAMITPLLSGNINRGMTFEQMIRASYKAVKACSRYMHDVGQAKDKILKRCSEKDWQFGSTVLGSVMQKFEEPSANWKADDR